MPPKHDSQDLTQPSSISAKSTAPTEVSPVSESSIPTVPAASSFDSTVLARPEGLIGKMLGERYFIEKELGHGGVGVVYLARDRRLVDKCVVVKVLLEEWLQDEWVVGKFLHEKEALARVDHPGIVGILDASELPDGKPYIVMQCVDGVTLRSVMQHEGMEIERTARVLEQMTDAIGEAHEAGILHRDLKPENIMLQPLGGGREQIKIIDFGIAKVRDSAVAPSTIVPAAVGTVAYMSPEQLSAMPLTTASDIYALGIIAYEMLTGRRPFNPESKFKMLEAQRAGVRVRPQDLRPVISERAQAVILKALAFDPKDRYQNAREFGRELVEALTRDARPTLVLHSEDATKNLANNSSEATRPRVNPRAILAATLLVIGIIGIVLWWVSRSAGNRQNQTEQPAASLPVAQRSLTYSLLVQKMRDGKPDEELSEFTGQEVFKNGDKFRFNVSSPQSGYLYLLNKSAQGTSNSDVSSLTMLYPTPMKNEGSAHLTANEPMQTSWNVFGGKAGIEQFWIVWATEPIAEIEAAKEIAFQNGKGALTDALQAQKVREFLAKYAAQKVDMTKDEIKKLTTIQGTGTILVDLVKLEHQ